MTEYGTGALNIDGCRVGVTADDIAEMSGRSGRRTAGQVFTGKGDGQSWEPTTAGRWPANLVLTHAADCAEACAEGCPVAELDGQSGERPHSFRQSRNHQGGEFGWRAGNTPGHNDTGGASRFFTVTEWDPADDPFRYVAKPSKAERNAGLDGLPKAPKKQTGGDWADGNFVSAPMANVHPTVKPLALMRNLVRLVTPPGGTVLDPFLGSGTTAVAATLEGFSWIGCEMTADYVPIIKGRVKWAAGERAAGRADKPQTKTLKPKKAKPSKTEQLPLDDAA